MFYKRFAKSSFKNNSKWEVLYQRTPVLPRLLSLTFALRVGSFTVPRTNKTHTHTHSASGLIYCPEGVQTHTQPHIMCHMHNRQDATHGMVDVNWVGGVGVTDQLQMLFCAYFQFSLAPALLAANGSGNGEWVMGAG